MYTIYIIYIYKYNIYIYTHIYICMYVYIYIYVCMVCMDIYFLINFKLFSTGNNSQFNT